MKYFNITSSLWVSALLIQSLTSSTKKKHNPILIRDWNNREPWLCLFYLKAKSNKKKMNRRSIRKKKNWMRGCFFMNGTAANLSMYLCLILTQELVASTPSTKNWRGMIISIVVICSIIGLIVTAVIIISPKDQGPHQKGQFCHTFSNTEIMF